MKEVKSFTLLIALFLIILVVNTPLISAIDASDYESPTGTRGAAARGLLGTSRTTANLGEQIIINVVDTQPVMVRQSMLEQQNIPVFVYLKGTHIGSLFSALSDDPEMRDPFSGITNKPIIKDIRIKQIGASQQAISGTPRYIAPAKRDFSLSNMGYLIINLKKNKNFNNLPTKQDYLTNITSSAINLSDSPVLDIKLQADIYFDLQKGSLFGVGEQQRVLEQIADDKAFDSRKDIQQYAILGGKAYVRATDISSNSVSIMLYDKSRSLLSVFSPAMGSTESGVRPIASTRLTLSNPVSSNINLGSTGDPFTDSFKIRLDKIVEPQSTANVLIEVNGQTTESILRKGESLSPSSEWKVEEIYTHTTHRKNAATSKEKKDFRSELADMGIDDTKLKTGLEDLKIETHQILLKNIHSGRTARLSSKVLKSGVDDENIEFAKLDDSKAQFLEELYCPAGAANPDLACLAVNNLKDILVKFSDSKEQADALFNLAEIYNNNLISPAAYKNCDVKAIAAGTADSAKCQLYKSDMRNLAVYYYQRVILSNPIKAEEARQKLEEASTKKYDSVDLLDQDFPIKVSLKSTRIITDEEKGTATIKIESSNYEKEYHKGDTFMTGENIKFEGFEGEDYYNYVIDSIDSKRVVLKQVFSGASTSKGSQVYLLSDDPPKDINYYTGKASERTSKLAPPNIIRASITKIDSKSNAYITILPPFDSAMVSTNFTVHIPIEPRPFSLTPDQLKNQINSTKELLAKMDKIIENLDSTVRTWKRTCIIVFGALIVKNSLLQGTSRNLARKSVSSFFKKKCADELAVKSPNFDTPAECYSHYSDEMTKAIDREQGAIDKVQKQLEGKSANNPDFAKYAATGGSITNYRDYLKYKALNDTLGSIPEKDRNDYDKYTMSQASQNQIDFQKRITLGDDATTAATTACSSITPEQAKSNCINAQRAVYIQTATAPETTSSAVKSTRLEGIVDTGKDTATSYVKSTAGTLENIELKRITQLQLKIYEVGSVDALIDAERGIIEKDLKGQDVNRAARQQPDLENMIQIRLKQNLEQYNRTTANSNGNDLFVTQDKINLVSISLCGTTPTTPPAAPPTPACPASVNYPVLAKSTAPTELYSKSGPLTLELPTDSKARVDPKNGFFTSSTGKYGDQTYNKEYSGSTITAQFNKDGKPYCYPVKIDDKANYVQVLDWYPGSGEARIIRLVNVGPNGIIDCKNPDDIVIQGEDALEKNTKLKEDLLNKINGKRCPSDGGEVGDTVDGKRVVCSKNSFLSNQLANAVECFDTMDPGDCRILFNACDPVMCPTSRCNLAGAYTPKNGVIASGMVGSLILCTPNFPTVVVPFCLTGILSGLRGYRSIVAGYAECLEANLKDGSNVGICDYANSVGICEILWRETMSILDIKGGVLNWIGGKIFGDPKGGGEYLTFQSALDNVGQSVKAFSQEYSETKISAMYQGKSTEEFGSAVCRKSVNSKFPTIGNILDQLSEPEDAPQFYAWFDSVSYAAPGNVAGAEGTKTPYNTKELEQYTVFYHIYAGSGSSAPTTLAGNNPIEQQTPYSSSKGVRYAVILKDDKNNQLFVTNPVDAGADEGTIASGGFVQKTVNAIAQPGLTEICVIINGKKSCGFKRVTTDYAMDYAKDHLVEGPEVSRKNITNAEDCSIGVKTAGAKIGNTASPIDSGLFSSSVTRLCSPQPPTPETQRWKDVGVCGKDANGLDLGVCWLDKNSIHIEDTEYKASILKGLKEGETKIGPDGKPIPVDVYSSSDSKAILFKLNQERDKLLKLIQEAYDNARTSSTTSP